MKKPAFTVAFLMLYRNCRKGEKMKKLLVLCLAMALSIGALSGCGKKAESNSASTDTGIGLELGQAMPDFTVALTDGTSATLSETLKEKDLVVLNIFASWCGPCEREFPGMESVYQANKDRVEIISVSGDPSDTMEVISDYKSGHGLSFPMGLAGDGLSFLKVAGFPTTVFIDRDGKVGFVKIGAFASEKDFEEKINVFLSPEYDGKPLAFEKAFSPTPYLLIWAVIGTILMTIGRWRILRKAGKKGWHSLIPFLNVFQEYSVCWKGWIGILAEVCRKAAFAFSMAGLPVVYYVLLGVGFLIGIPEGLKLAKAFGKGTVFGVLLAVPGFKQIGRIILGLGKAKFQAPETEAAA
jgi:thiol-disulfide isomerase/thioredoxin